MQSPVADLGGGAIRELIIEGRKFQTHKAYSIGAIILCCAPGYIICRSGTGNRNVRIFSSEVVIFQENRKYLIVFSFRNIHKRLIF